MGIYRTTSSVTNVHCRCYCLNSSTNDLDTHIKFNCKTNKHFCVSDRIQSESYHCPLCGQATPEVKKRLWFHKISLDESKWLYELLNPIKNIKQMVDTLGKPDLNTFSNLNKYKKIFKTWIMRQNNEMHYYKLSQVATIIFCEKNNGNLKYEIRANRCS
ncbi:MAG: hypothetical protein COA79_01275 [Planctomycetota bacterium]|nr:MAG: hypothetical protein COA79_01275 [Planctomycetota bacterium]